MLQERDVFKLLGSFVASEVQKQVEKRLQPLLTALDTAQKQIAICETKNAAMREQLDAIADCIDESDDSAKNEMMDWTREYVTGAIYALPKGEKGDPGETGARGERGEQGEKGERGEPGEQGEAGKDGSHGAHGADGKSLCLDDVRGCLVDLVDQAVSRIPVQPHCVGGIIDRDGALSLTFSDGSLKGMGKIVGRDGKDCDMELVGRQVAEFLATIEKPKDGVGIESMEYDGERTFTFSNGNVVKTFTIPTPIYQGLWKPGNYVRGDEVTSDGSQFIAMRDTDKEPGTIDSGWRLACKRGRDGKNGKDGSAVHKT